LKSRVATTATATIPARVRKGLCAHHPLHPSHIPHSCARLVDDAAVCRVTRTCALGDGCLGNIGGSEEMLEPPSEQEGKREANAWRDSVDHARGAAVALRYGTAAVRSRARLTCSQTGPNSWEADMRDRQCLRLAPAA
jgi:hypothetical protein